MADILDLELLKGDEKVVAEAKQRFSLVEQWEADFRKAFLSDVRFANADSLNGWQWPNDIRRNRDIDERPVLTVNKTHMHCQQIINESMQNPASVKVRPTGGGSTAESANIYEGVVRRIEYISNAQAAYEKAVEFQVYGGLGFWRIVTDYSSDDSFDQEIFIRRIKDPLNVYIDMDINEIDGSDARYGFIFDDMPKDVYKRKYPNYAYVAGKAALGNSDMWITEDHVRVCEYYRAVDKKEKLVAFMDPETQVTTILKKSDIAPALREAILSDPTTRTRDIIDRKIEWFLIAGDEIIDRRDWPGRYVPIVRIVGSELIVGGELDRKGHTRALIDPQRIYNYWTSSAVEHVALQAKMPYKAPAAAIEGYETYWETANRINYSVLPYKHVDDEGNTIPPPEREQPPQMAQAYVQGMQISANEMMMVSGQYQSTLGEKSNEVTGKAINARQRQGENATYHFINNFAHGVRFTGKILIDLIPKIYDTPRILKILAEDGSGSDVQLDPNQKQAYAEQTDRITQAVQRIFNPNVGKYDVESEIGPNYGTRREEAFNAFTQIAAQSPEMMSLVGDLMFKNADFPGADEIAERLRRMVPGQALGKDAPPEVQMLQQQVQNNQGIITKLVEELSSSRLQLKDKTDKDEVDTYKAITDRLKALLPTMINPADIARSVIDMQRLEHANSLKVESMTTGETVNDDVPQGD